MTRRSLPVLALAAACSGGPRPASQPTSTPESDVLQVAEEPAPAPAHVAAASIECDGPIRSLYDAPERLGERRAVAGGVSGHYGFSPDGAWLLYIRSGKLHVERPAGGDARVLSGATYFAVTPDSKHAIASGTVAHPLAGGPPVNLLGRQMRVSSVQIAPDSDAVGVSGIGGPVHLTRISAPRPDEILPPHRLGMMYRFTPDARHVVYRGDEHVHLRPLDDPTGRSDVDLTPGLGRTDLGFLIPDAAVVTSDGIYVAPLNGSGPRLVAESHSWPPRKLGDGFVFHDTGRNLYYVAGKDARPRQVSRPLVEGEQVSPFVTANEQMLFYDVLVPRPQGQDVGRDNELRAATLRSPEDRPIAVACRSSTVIIHPTPDGTRALIHVHTEADQQALFSLDLSSWKISRLTPMLPGWSNLRVSGDSRHALLAVPTRTKQPREYDLHLVELPD